MANARISGEVIPALVMIKLAEPEASLLLAAALRQIQPEACRDPTGVYAEVERL